MNLNGPFTVNTISGGVFVAKAVSIGDARDYSHWDETSAEIIHSGLIMNGGKYHMWIILRNQDLQQISHV